MRLHNVILHEESHTLEHTGARWLLLVLENFIGTKQSMFTFIILYLYMNK